MTQKQYLETDYNELKQRLKVIENSINNDSYNEDTKILIPIENITHKCGCPTCARGKTKYEMETDKWKFGGEE